MSGPLPPERIFPDPARLDPRRADYAEILRRHQAAVESGAAQYVDPATGYLVFTAQFLWEREECCDTGCRHCPYGERPDLAKPRPPR